MSTTLSRPEHETRLPAVEIPHACEQTPADVAGAPRARKAGRVIGVDVARGLALVGMMAVHVLPAVSEEGQLSTAWLLSAGKASALFAVLAGVGIAFASGGLRRPDGRRWKASAVSLVVRAAIIGGVGLLLGYVVPISNAVVILPYYAVLFLLAIPLLSLSRRALIILAAVLAVAAPVVSHVARAQLPTAELTTNPTLGHLQEPLVLLQDLALIGEFPALTWFAYLCVGLAVGRSTLSSRTVAAGLMVVGLVLAVAASAGSWLVMTVLGGWQRVQDSALSSTMTVEMYTDEVVWGMDGVTPATTAWWLGVMSPHSGTPFDLVHTIGVALGVIGLCLLLGRALTGVLAPLAAAGSMTFTLYTLHLLMLSAPVQLGSAGTWFAVQVVVLVAFAWLWAKRAGRGPLEALVWWTAGRVRQGIAEPTRRVQPV